MVVEGCYSASLASGERHSGLLGRLTGSETRSHTDSGNHAVSAFRYISLWPLPRYHVSSSSAEVNREEMET